MDRFGWLRRQMVHRYARLAIEAWADGRRAEAASYAKKHDRLACSVSTTYEPLVPRLDRVLTALMMGCRLQTLSEEEEAFAAWTRDNAAGAEEEKAWAAWVQIHA